MSQFDRFLVSLDWEIHLYQVQQEALPNPVSDHLLILLKQLSIKRGPYPSGSSFCGLKCRGSRRKKGMVSGIQFFWFYLLCLRSEAKELMTKTRMWKSETFGHLDTLKERCLELISLLDLKDQV